MSNKQKPQGHKQNRKPKLIPPEMEGVACPVKSHGELRVGQPMPVSNGQLLDMFSSLDPQEMARMMLMGALKNTNPKPGVMDIIVLRELLGQAASAAVMFAGMVSGVLDDCLIPVITEDGELSFQMTAKGERVKTEHDAKRGQR